MNYKNVHGKRSRRNGAVQAKRSLLSPDFYLKHRLYLRNPGAVAMGSTIRLRSGTMVTFYIARAVHDTNHSRHESFTVQTIHKLKS
ncbi:hypothetical protein [Paenibacillus kribbensis]|uniref:hypothetical protein n=1 Tax=Paenibacillus kribbensis TaxID=172713 RepID=UPI001C3FFB27|nr:hypothetical protein [Paenibacillus kribbensis]